MAYQVVGTGSVDLVLGLPSISHLGVWWEYPPAAEFFRGLAAFSRLILFDKRGVGLSDRSVGIPTLEERIDDIRAVMDAAGSPKAVILGVSESAAMSILFTASHPERVLGLILSGGEARVAWAPDNPWGSKPEDVETWLRAVEKEWGTLEFARRFADGLAPGREKDIDYNQFISRLITYSASPAAAVALTRMNFGIDVRSVLTSIHVPTLVLVEESDYARAASGYLASHITGAKLVKIPGKAHFFLVFPESIASVLESVRTFLDEVPGTAESDRILTTVLFVDVVGSTRHVTQLGDRSWGKLFGEYMEKTLAELARFQGRLIKTTGDGFLAIFDGPTRAIRCACALRDLAQKSGFEIRAGLHSGECLLKEKDVQGIAVHIAARVSERAADNEVLVSATVRDLSIGSDIRLVDRGAQSLKGVDGEWRMYAVASL